MIWEIDFESDEALYLQVVNSVIEQIAASTLQNGDSLPSVRRLADQIGINMHTVNKAYAILRQEGYLTMDRHRGAVICLNADRMQAMEECRADLRSAAVKAISKGVSREELRELLEEVCQEFHMS